MITGETDKQYKTLKVFQGLRNKQKHRKIRQRKRVMVRGTKLHNFLIVKKRLTLRLLPTRTTT